MKHTRIGWVDTLRAIGILLVVAGHVRGFGKFPRAVIYSFHMPLFFAISGFLTRDEHLRAGIGSYLRRLGRRLLVPYLFFWAVSYLYWLLTREHRLYADWFQEFSAFYPVQAFLVGTTDLLIINQTLWFFPCLFMTSILFYAVYRLGRWPWILAALVSLAACGHYLPTWLGYRLPWGMDLSMITVLFYGLGHGCRVLRVHERPLSAPAAQALMLGAALINVLCVTGNGRIELHSYSFGAPVLFYVGAFSGVIFAYCLARLLPATRVAQVLARDTIVIFPLHPIVFGVFTGVAVYVFDARFGLTDRSAMWSLVYFIGATAVCLAVAPWMWRLAPWAVGGKRKERKMTCSSE